MAHFAGLEVGSPEGLQEVVGLLFSKALAEPHYCETYADLILALDPVFPKFRADSKLVSFKTLLLDICQAEFEAAHAALAQADEAKEERTALEGEQEEAELRKQRRKARILANMKLIGHLLLRRLLSVRVIARVLEELLLKDQEAYVPAEHAIECACVLLATAGQELESRPPALGGGLVVQWACKRLTQLQALQEPGGRAVYSKRLQFVVRDLLDARSAGWATRSFQKVAKTKGEVQLEQQQELASRAAAAEGATTKEQVVVRRKQQGQASMLGRR